MRTGRTAAAIAYILIISCNVEIFHENNRTTTDEIWEMKTMSYEVLEK